MRFQIVKKRRIAQKPVFHHLAIARQQIALRQGVQHRCIGQHQRGLVERPDQVLAMGRIDACLATDRGINLRQQRRGQLHKAHPAPQNGAGKAHQIAHHSAPQSDDNIAAFDLFGQKPFNSAGKLGPSLGAFTGR